MAILHEMLLPVSHRGLRFREPSTKEWLNIQSLARKRAKGDDSAVAVSGSIEGAASLIDSYTEPLKPVFVQANDADGKEVETGIIDVDATLDAVSPGAWRKTGYLELITDGPGHLLSVLDKPHDFGAVDREIARKLVGDSSPLQGKTRMVCVEK